MCDQTNLPYLDGNVVWVKISSCWWPGQVVDQTKLPEDVQQNIRNKSLIAVVKFFQEDAYEFVKDISQIYMYNCTHKDDFIKKGLDKYRARQKDGSSYMDKFIPDVETAEKLTDGDPNILLDKKFSTEEKADIASLFGSAKKLPKKKRLGDGPRKSTEGIRKKHREMNRDHASHLPVLQNSVLNSHYPCFLCSFFTTRVDVMSYHLRSHRKNEDGLFLSDSSQKGKSSGQFKHKRKSLKKKDKPSTSPSNGESSKEGLKRKQKDVEKINKKKKVADMMTDLIAEWDDTSNDNQTADNLTMDTSVSNMDTTDTTADVTLETSATETKSTDLDTDSFLEETDKLLKATEKFTEMAPPIKTVVPKYSIKSPTTSGEKYSLKDKLSLASKSEDKQLDEDKKSRLSCFDFDEEDPEPTIPHVRKIPRSSSMPLKKEIVKEFEKSQALENEKVKKSLEVSSNKMNSPFQDKLKKFSMRVRESDNKSMLKDFPSSEVSVKYDASSNLEKSETWKTPDSPLKRDSSPNKKDLSPIKKDVSPIKFNLSPVKQDFHLVSKDSSPIKTDSHVRTKDVSPVKADLSLIKNTPSPVKMDLSPTRIKSPIKRELSPIKRDLSPIKMDSSPVKKDLSPVKDKSPLKKDLSPIKDTSPVKKNLSPIKDTSPVRKGMSFDRKDSSPFPEDVEKPESPVKNAVSTIEENVEILEIVEFEAEEENVNFRKDTEQKTQPVMGFHEGKHEIQPFLDQNLDQTETMLTETKDFSMADNESLSETTATDVSTQNESVLSEEADIEEVKKLPVKRGRGRPKKQPLPFQDNGKKVQEPIELDKPSETIEKPSEGDFDRSFSRRKRKPNMKYYDNFESETYLSSPEHRSFKTDDSQSDIEDKPLEEKKVLKKRGRKPKTYYLQQEAEKQKALMESNEKNLLNSMEETSDETKSDKESKKIELNFQNQSEDQTETVSAMKINFLEEVSSALPLVSKTSEYEHQKVKENEKVIQADVCSKQQETTIDILPPKKSQIKKFEQAQLESLENKNEPIPPEPGHVVKMATEKVDIDDKTNVIEETTVENNFLFTEVSESDENLVTKENQELKESKIVAEQEPLKPEPVLITESQNIDTDLPVEKKESEPTEAERIQKSPAKTRHKINYLPSYPYKPKREFIEENVANSFQEAFLKTMQIDLNELKKTPKEPEVTQIHNEVDGTVKIQEPNEMSTNEEESLPAESDSVETTIANAKAESKISLLSIDTPRFEESMGSTPSPSSDVSVPVKKREKPRIIEDVTLSEPFVFKSQILETPSKNLKHKLQAESGVTKSKVLRLDNSKAKTPMRMTLVKNVPIQRKSDNQEQIVVQQQGSLEDMELDINNIPFVLSEDITPESIEQMPVVISSVPVQTSLSPQATSSGSCLKRKSETPTILKSKSKNKPALTNITTFKSIKLTGQQSLQTPTLIAQKGNGNSGYYIVQTMPGKLSHPQKVAMQVDKSSNNAQIVQQGGKVVITPVGGTKKIQRIVTNRSQVYSTSPNSPGIVTSPKSMIAVRGDTIPTTSKVVSQGQNIIISNKSGSMIRKIKGGILTSVPGSNFSGKATLISTKSKPVYAGQPGLSRSSIAIGEKVTTSKGTVLTPITRQEIKAITAKSSSRNRPNVVPATVQSNINSPMSSSPTIIYKNAAKLPSKKNKIVVQTSSVPLLSSFNSNQSVSVLSPGQQKTKVITGAQKYIVAKSNEAKVPLQTVSKVVQSKAITMADVNDYSPIIKTPSIKGKTASSQKGQVVKSPNVPASKPIQQKNLLDVALSSAFGVNFDEQGTLDTSTSIVEEKPEEQVIPVEETKPETVETPQPAEKVEASTIAPGQIFALPGDNTDGICLVYVADEHGNLSALDYPIVIGESGEALSNIVVQTVPGNNDLTAAQAVEPAATEIGPSGSEDILAAALANADFQQDMEAQVVTVASTSLVSQTIMQSNSISTSETSPTLKQSIMTPLEVPSNTGMPIQSETMTNVPSVVKTPSSLELPITITDPNISYITSGETQMQISGSSMPEINDIIETSATAANVVETSQAETSASTQYIVVPGLEENIVLQQSQAEGEQIPVAYSFAIPDNMIIETSQQVQTPPSMPIIDDNYSGSFTETAETTVDASYTDVPVSEMLISKPNESTADTMTNVMAPSGPSMGGQEVIEVSVESVAKEEVVETQIDALNTEIVTEETVVESIPDVQMEQEEVPLQEEVSLQEEVPVQQEVTLQQEEEGVQKQELCEQVEHIADFVQEEVLVESEGCVSEEIIAAEQEQCIPSEGETAMQTSEQMTYKLMDTSEMPTEVCEKSEETCVAIEEELVVPSTDGEIKEVEAQSEEVTETDHCIEKLVESVEERPMQNIEQSIQAPEETIEAIEQSIQETNEPMQYISDSEQCINKSYQNLEESHEVINEAHETHNVVDESISDVDESQHAICESIKAVNISNKEVNEFESTEAFAVSEQSIDEYHQVISEPITDVGESQQMICESIEATKISNNGINEFESCEASEIPSEETNKFESNEVVEISNRDTNEFESNETANVPNEEEFESTETAEVPSKNIDDFDSTEVVNTPNKVIGEPNKDEYDKDIDKTVRNFQESEHYADELMQDINESSQAIDKPTETIHDVEANEELAQVLEEGEPMQGIESNQVVNDECMSDQCLELNEPMKGGAQVAEEEQTDEAECVDAIDDSTMMGFEETETSQEAPSQSFERIEVPSQSAKSENSREPTQSYADADADAPTQSYNEILEERKDDDSSFPTQSYEVEKPDDISENLDSEPELSQEGVPSQSNDDAIGTSLISNSLGLNEDETASSSYVPETPETQERDQDQESAISTSSYEIPPCDELNIASSSVIPDTSVEHLSIHDNGVPEIPTSSYNFNPDSSSTHRDAVPTSSYEDQVIVEQNVSTSYDSPMSMSGLGEASSPNFVTESTDQRNEPSSYYLHQQEVSASYYNPGHHDDGGPTDARLKRAEQGEVSASYYEGVPRNEASQSYFAAEEATPSYCGQNLSSPGYYDAEASQSFYSGERSALQNVEASQSFYREGSERRDGEAYPERYQDYTPADSPIDRHNLVESSSTRPR